MKVESVETLIANLHVKKEYVVHIRNLKQRLGHGLVLKRCVESLNSITKPW